MEFPKTIENCLTLIEKKDAAFAGFCRERIERLFTPDYKDYWFDTSAWLKKALKCIKFQQIIESEYQVKIFIDAEDVNNINFKSIGKRVLEHLITEKIEKDMPILISKFHQLKFMDEFGDYDMTSWIKYFSRYFEKRIVPVICDFIELSSSYCDKESLVSINFLEIANEEFVRRIGDYPEEVLDTNEVDPSEFERLCASILAENGWQCHVTKASSDQGVDVIAEKENFKIAIQCKLYNSNVPNKAVQEVFAGSAFYKCNASMVVSNADFTVSARQLGESLNVYLVPFENLLETAENIFHTANCDL